MTLEELLGETPVNPCIKTGATVVAGDTAWHGDLFIFGDYYLLNCTEGPLADRPNHIHAQFETWEMTFQSGRVIVFRHTHLMYYDYVGKHVMRLGDPG